MSRPHFRNRAIGGVVGPVAFISGWVVGGTVTGRDYSPIDDAISRLAAIGADTRIVMTAGFVAFGVSLPIFAAELRRVIDGPAWIAATATGIATLAVAATPLDVSATVDTFHGVFATAGYITLAATPLLAARPLWRKGHHVLAAAGIVATCTSALSLALTASSLPTGFFQRLGLTATDLWIIAVAVSMLTGQALRS